MAIFDTFWPKRPIFEFFSKIRLEHFFTLPKPYLIAKFQKKVMKGCLDMSVTHIRTYVHTYIHTNEGQLIGLPAARPKSKYLSSGAIAQTRQKETGERSRMP